MTAFLFVLVPVALFALIAASCFVGCGGFLGLDDKVFDGGGPPDKALPFTTYRETDVIGPDCIAFWPLDQAKLDPASGDSLAPDVVGNNTGTYKSVDINNGKYINLFPCPMFTVDPSRPVDSAWAPGTLTIGAPGIVQGDTLPPHDPANPMPAPAMHVDGGFVEVPFNQVLNPDPPFTIEAWAQADEVGAAFRAVIDSRNQGGGLFFGYAIWVNEDGNWQAQVGATGSGNYIEVLGGPADTMKPTHLALTVDKINGAKLFINGIATQPVPWPPAALFARNTNALASLVIGAGMAYLSPRTQPSDNNFFPLLPFKGTIQDVAIYSKVLPDQTISDHFQHGSGNSGK